MSTGVVKTTFRLRGLPIDWGRHQVCAFLRQSLEVEIEGDDLATLATDPLKQEKVATFSFESQLLLDTHFHGLTPVHSSLDEECTIDCIAITGLQGHAFGSFKQKNGSFMWLRDALPRDFPQARVFLYGYDTIMTPSESTQNISHLGTRLASILQDILVSSRRDLLILGHSLGGLVIEEALSQLAMSSVREELRTRFRGLLEFGVPHQGMAIDALHAMVEGQPNQILIDDLGTRSSYLPNLCKIFSRTLHDLDASGKVVAFFETKLSPTVQRNWKDGSWGRTGPLHMLVHEHSACYGSHTSASINGDHSGIVKFESAQDEGYALVRRSIHTLLQKRNSNRNDLVLDRGSIPLTHPLDDFLKLKVSKQPAPETCSWIFNTTQYKMWNNSTSSGLFLITGMPGTGKTVIATYLADIHEDPREVQPVKCRTIHYFCNANSHERNSAIAILRGLLYQLCRDERLFEDHMQKEYSLHPSPKASMLHNFEALWRVFDNIVRDSRLEKVLVVIDALDECDRASQERFLEYLDRLLSKMVDHAPCLKVVLTARSTPWPDFHCQHNHLPLTQQNLAGDLETYIAHEMTKFSYPPLLKEEVKSTLQNNTEGTFLWVHLAIAQLKGVPISEVRKNLSRFPTQLNGIYDKALERIPPPYRAGAQFIFHMMAASQRPFTADEILFAQYVHSRDGWTIEPPDEEYIFPVDLVRNCSELVYLVPGEGGGTLQFLHQTAKEYLCRDLRTEGETTLSYTIRLCRSTWEDEETFHLHALRLFSKVCILVVYMVVWKFTVWISQSLALRRFLTSPVTLRFSLLRIAFEVSLTIGLTVLQICQRQISSVLELPSWTRIYYNVDLATANLLVFQACFKILSIQSPTDFDISQQISVNSYETLVSYAEQELQEHALGAAEQLIDFFPWKEEMIYRHRRALDLWLGLAATKRHPLSTRFITLLLRTGSHLESREVTRGTLSYLTPLAIAAACGNNEVVRLLLQEGAEMESRDTKGWTPLRWAAFGTHVDTVITLLESGADVDASDDNKDTALLWMMGNAVEPTVNINRFFDPTTRQLLDGHGLKTHERFIEVSQWDEGRGLSNDHSAQRIVDILSKQSLNIDMLDRDGMTALCRASRNHQWAFVDILLRNGANSNVLDRQGMTALLWALRSPRKTLRLAKMSFPGSEFYMFGAIIDRRYSRMVPSLSVKDYERSIRALISKTNDIEARDFTGRSALSLAAENGYPETLKQLIAKGANIGSIDNHRRNPLIWASKTPTYITAKFNDLEFGDKAIVLLGNIQIVERTSRDDILRMVSNTDGWERWRSEILETLLEKSPNPYHTDDEGKNALDHAYADDRVNVVKILEDSGLRAAGPSYQRNGLLEAGDMNLGVMPRCTYDSIKLGRGGIIEEGNRIFVIQHGPDHNPSETNHRVSPQSAGNTYGRIILDEPEHHHQGDWVEIVMANKFDKAVSGTEFDMSRFHDVVISGGGIFYCDLWVTGLAPSFLPRLLSSGRR